MCVSVNEGADRPLLQLPMLYPRPTASHHGVLEEVEAADTAGVAREWQRARPVLSLAEIKRMNRPTTEEGGDDADDVGLGLGLFGEGGTGEEEAAACWPKYTYALEVQAPWSRRLLDGTKTIETRAYSLPTAVLHASVLLVESPGGGGLAAHGLGAVSPG